jgi:hypothetical protein
MTCRVHHPDTILMPLLLSNRSDTRYEDGPCQALAARARERSESGLCGKVPKREEENVMNEGRICRSSDEEAKHAVVSIG